jgi:hypothetical protein
MFVFSVYRMSCLWLNEVVQFGIQFLDICGLYFYLLSADSNTKAGLGRFVFSAYRMSCLWLNAELQFGKCFKNLRRKERLSKLKWECWKSGAMTFRQCDISSKGHFIYHFISSTFCQPAVSSTCHCGNLLFCELAISSITISSNCYLVNFPL